MDSFKKEVGLNFKMFRHQLGIKQSELAEKIGERRANISSIESGVVFPKMSILVACIKIFRLSIDWLLTGEGEMFIGGRRMEAKISDFYPDLPEIGKWETLFNIIQKEPLQSYIRISALQQDEIINQDLYIEKNFKTLTKINQIVEEEESEYKLKKTRIY